MKSSWNKIARLPETWKSKLKNKKRVQKTDWDSRGDLKGIRTVDKRFARKH